MTKKLLPGVCFRDDLRLLIYRPRGVLVEDEISRIVLMLLTLEEEAGQAFNRYTDLSQLEGVNLSMKFVCRVSLHRRAVYERFPPVKSAFYVTGDAAAAAVES